MSTSPTDPTDRPVLLCQHDTVPLPGVRLDLWDCHHPGEGPADREPAAVLFARDAGGVNRRLVLTVGETAPVPGLPGWLVSLQGVRAARTLPGEPWAVVRLHRA